MSIALDGELSELERAMLHAHLRRCGSCAEAQDAISSFTGVIRATPLEPVLWTMWTPRQRGRTRLVARVAAATTAVAVAAGVSLSLVPLERRVEPTRPALRARVISVADTQQSWTGGVPRGKAVNYPFAPGQAHIEAP
jgi:hypothetical protein